MKQEIIRQFKKLPILEDEKKCLSALIEIYLKLEKINGVNKATLFPLSRSLAYFDETAIVEMASLTRSYFKAGTLPILDLVATCENYRLRVIVFPMDKSVNSFFVNLREVGIFIVLNASDTAERKNFSLAYELGALIFGSKDLPEELLQSIATNFAAAFLMPEGTVRQSLINFGFSEFKILNFEMLLNIKSRFGVSAEAFLKRLFHFSIIAEKNYSNLLQQLEEYYHKTNFQEPWLKGHIAQLSENGRLFNLVELGLSQKKIGKAEGKMILEKFGW